MTQEAVFNKHSWAELGAISPSKSFCLKAMDEWANIKMIEENQSMLEMAEIHCDSRTIFVIVNRIKELKLKYP